MRSAAARRPSSAPRWEGPRSGPRNRPQSHRPASDGRNGEQVRIAVNGQTGRAAAVVFSDKRETHIVAPLNPSLHLSGESTVHATPVEVKYIKSPFLYQIVRRGGDEQPRQVAAAAEGSYREEKPKRKGLFAAIFGK